MSPTNQTEDGFDFGAVLSLQAPFGIKEQEFLPEDNMPHLSGFYFGIDQTALLEQINENPDSVYSKIFTDYIASHQEMDESERYENAAFEVVRAAFPDEFQYLQSNYGYHRDNYNISRLEEEGKILGQFALDSSMAGTDLNDYPPYKEFLARYPEERLPEDPEFKFTDEGGYIKVEVPNLSPEIAESMLSHYEVLAQNQANELLQVDTPKIPFQAFATAKGVNDSQGEWSVLVDGTNAPIDNLKYAKAEFYLSEWGIKNYLSDYTYFQNILHSPSVSEEEKLRLTQYINENPNYLGDYNNPSYLQSALAEAMQLPEGYLVNVVPYEYNNALDESLQQYYVTITTANEPDKPLKHDDQYDAVINNLKIVLSGGTLTEEDISSYPEVERPRIGHERKARRNEQTTVEPSQETENGSALDQLKANVLPFSELFDKSDFENQNLAFLSGIEDKINQTLGISDSQELRAEDYAEILRSSLNKELLAKYGKAGDSDYPMYTAEVNFYGEEPASYSIILKPYRDMYPNKNFVLEFEGIIEEVSPSNNVVPTVVPTQTSGATLDTPHPGGGGR